MEELISVPVINANYKLGRNGNGIGSDRVQWVNERSFTTYLWTQWAADKIQFW